MGQRPLLRPVLRRNRSHAQTALRLLLVVIAAIATPGCDTPDGSSGCAHDQPEAEPAGPLVDLVGDTVGLTAYRAKRAGSLSRLARERQFGCVVGRPDTARIAEAATETGLIANANDLQWIRGCSAQYGDVGLRPSGTDSVVTRPAANHSVSSAIAGKHPDGTGDDVEGDLALDVPGRRAVIHALVEDGSAAAVARLAEALSDPDPHLREDAVHALEAIGNQSAAPALLHALFDAAPAVRSAAVAAMAEVAGEYAVTALATALQDQDAAVRETAVWALVESDDPSARRYLAQALHDSDDAVRAAAAQGLEELSGDGPEPAGS